MFEDAIRYPWNGAQKVETILIGGVLSLLGVFFVPTLFVYGYLVRVVRQVAAGDDEVPPVFDEWGDLLVDGLLAFVISLVYFLVPAVVIGFAVLAFVLPVGVGGSGGDALALVGVLLAAATVLVALLALLAAVYLFPAAIAAFARTGSFGAAFSPSILRTIGTNDDYAVAWLLAVVIGVLAQVVGGAVALTVVGLLLVPFVGFYGNVAAAYVIGRGIAATDVPGDRTGDAAVGQPAV